MDKQKFKKRNNIAETPKYWVRLTRACNNNCVFCLDKQNQNGSFISFKEIKKELKKGRKKGIKKAILSGGDPTLHPDYLEIVKFCKSIGYEKIQTITNGRMFAYKNFLEKAVENGLTEITFSIHGHNKKLYEAQSGIKGSFNQAITGLLNALKTKKLIVNIDIVISKINYKYLEKIIKFFIDLGVKEFDLLQVVPFGGGWENRKKLFYSPKTALPYLQKAFSLQKEFPDIYLWTNRFPPIYLEGCEELIQHPVKLSDEIRGRKDMFERFIKTGKIMDCHGERCRYCFLEKFCADFIEIRKAGELSSLSQPLCLKVKQEPNGIFLWKNFNINKFLNFFIKNRYFIKSLRCGACRYDKNCSGMRINYIREYGFRELKPLK